MSMAERKFGFSKQVLQQILSGREFCSFVWSTHVPGLANQSTTSDWC